jgi:hypothetical protein
MRPRAKAVLCILFVAGLISLAACNFPPPAAPQDVSATSAAETVSAELTLISLASPTVPSTNTPVPPAATDTPIATVTPVPTATVGCEDGSQFISDVTIPDNTVMKPGESFTKTWRLRNSGNCEWTTAFDAVFTDGSSMGGPAAQALAGVVPPNGTVDISINLTAPSTNGVHRGNYRMRNASDQLFGTLFYVQILVGPTPTPTVVVYRTGKLTVDNGDSIDFDGGTSTGDPKRDVLVKYVSASERYLEPKNGAKIKKMSDIPSLDDCKDASLSSGQVDFNDFSTNSYFCYKTSDGRYGRFQVEKIEADSVKFDFRTWN